MGEDSGSHKRLHDGKILFAGEFRYSCRPHQPSRRLFGVEATPRLARTFKRCGVNASSSHVSTVRLQTTQTRIPRPPFRVLAKRKRIKKVAQRLPDRPRARHAQVTRRRGHKGLQRGALRGWASSGACGHERRGPVAAEHGRKKVTGKTLDLWPEHRLSRGRASKERAEVETDLPLGRRWCCRLSQVAAARNRAGEPSEAPWGNESGRAYQQPRSMICIGIESRIGDLHGNSIDGSPPGQGKNRAQTGAGDVCAWL